MIIPKLDINFIYPVSDLIEFTSVIWKYQFRRLNTSKHLILGHTSLLANVAVFSTHTRSAPFQQGPPPQCPTPFLHGGR